MVHANLIRGETDILIDLAEEMSERMYHKPHRQDGAENFAVLRHIALYLLRRETTSKGSLKGRRKKAGWDNDYLLKVLTG